MKKSIIIPCIILAVCFLFFGLYIKECIDWNSGIIIENFDKDFESKLLSEFDLGNYGYIELTDVYYSGSGIDPYYIVSFKISKEYVGKFEKEYLSTKILTGEGGISLLPERDYTFEECKVYYPADYEPILNYNVYVKEHTDKDYFEYHIKNNPYGSSNREVRDLIRTYNTPFMPKNYRKIGHLKIRR